MPSRKRQPPLKLGDRARNKLNRRVGTVDAVDDVGGCPQYGMHYDESPQDSHLTMPGHDGARLHGNSGARGQPVTVSPWIDGLGCSIRPRWCS